MKNIITVDCAKSFSTSIEYIDDGTNTIFLKFQNVGTSSEMEIYYGADYKESVAVGEGIEIQAPPLYSTDNEIMRLRYVDGTKKSGFIIFYGDESIPESLQLQKINKYLFMCDSAPPKKSESEDDIYLKLLAALINETTEPTAKSCYNDLNELRTEYILQLYRLGQIGKDKSFADMLELLKKVKFSSPFEIYECSIAAFSLDTDIHEPIKVTLRGL